MLDNAKGDPGETTARFARAESRSACAACGSHTASGRPVCAECLTKVAQFNAMIEAVDEAMVGTERVAVALPSLVQIPHLSIDERVTIGRAVAQLWSGFPLFDGPAAEIDHLDPADVMPGSPEGARYLSSLLGRPGMRAHLLPRHLAAPMVSVEWLLTRVAEAAYLAGRRDDADQRDQLPSARAALSDGCRFTNPAPAEMSA